MQTTGTHQSMVRQKETNPRERHHRDDRRHRRSLRPPQKRNRSRERKVHRSRAGFLKGPKLAALVRVLRLRKMYISRFNSVTMPFDLYTFKGKVEERALVDSGATANFIDYKTVARLRLGTQKLDNIRTVKNIDGTLNRSGNITHCCDLLVSRDRKQERTRFF